MPLAHFILISSPSNSDHVLKQLIVIIVEGKKELQLTISKIVTIVDAGSGPSSHVFQENTDVTMEMLMKLHKFSQKIYVILQTCT